MPWASAHSSVFGKCTSFPAKRGSAQQVGELTPSNGDLNQPTLLLLDMGHLYRGAV